MIRRLLVLAALLAGLAAWDLALSAAERTARSESARVGPLVPKSDQARIPERLQALEVEAGGRAWRYLSFAGMWRCLDYASAPADLDALNSLVERLLSAAGVAQTADPAKFAGFGIGTSEAIVVTFHGERAVRTEGGRPVFAGDALLKLELGRPVPGRDGCYARLAGAKEVWAVDSSPLDLLEPVRAGRAPLLDENVVAKAWPGGKARSVEQVVVERGGELYDFTVRHIEIDPEEAQAGAVSFEWSLARNGAPVPCHSILTGYWTSFLLSAPWTEVLDPAAAARLDFDQPGAAAITLVPSEGEALRMRVLPPGPDGTAAVANPHTGCAYAISADVLRLFLADLALLDPAALENPWDDFMRARAER